MTFPVTPSTKVRVSERASYERAAADAILDEAFVAHVGFAIDGQPFVIPMVYGRDGDRLLLHGSVATRLARRLAEGVPVCVTVTLVDGLVIARSQFHHSINYRSVVVVGTARRVTDPAEVERAFTVIVDHVVPGRADEARPANRVETRQTTVLEIPIETASVKVRGHGPVDDVEDLADGGWSGIVPVDMVFGSPQADGPSSGRPPPPSLSPYRRPGSLPAHG